MNELWKITICILFSCPFSNSFFHRIKIEKEGPIKSINYQSNMIVFQVDYNRICVVGTGLDQDADDFIPVSVVRKWKETYEIEHRRGIQWIYYGSEQGVMYNYPAVRQCDSSYDPRYRLADV